MKKKVLVVAGCLLGSCLLSEDAGLVMMSEEQKKLQEEVEARWKEHARLMGELKNSFKKTEAQIKKQDKEAEKDASSKNLDQKKSEDPERSQVKNKEKKSSDEVVLQKEKELHSKKQVVSAGQEEKGNRSKARKRAQLEIDKLDTSLEASEAK